MKRQYLGHTINGDSMKQSRFCLFLFMLLYNYIFLRSIVFPHCYKEYGYNGIWIIIAVLVIVVLLLLIIPKKIYNKSYLNEYKNSKIKYLINSILIIRVVLGISIASITLYDLFFYKSLYYLIPLVFIIVTFIISNLKPNEVIELNTLFSLVVMLLYSLYIYDFIDLDFYLIKKSFSLSFSGISILFSLCLVFDNLLLLLSNEKSDKPKKLTIISGMSLAIITVLFEYVLLVLSAGDYIFINERYIGYLTLLIEPVSRYNGNFDYIYILFLGCGAIFKFSYILSLIRNSINIKFNPLKIILFIAILFSLSAFIYFIYEAINIYLTVIIILIVLGLCIGFWIIKECYYAKKA